MKKVHGGLRVPHPVVVLHRHGVTLACAPNGSLAEELPHGLFAGDTRVLSTHQLAISGYPWNLLGRTTIDSAEQVWVYQNPKLSDSEGEIPPGSLALVLRRLLDGTLQEEIEISSFAKRTIQFRLTLKLDSDFSDIFEVRDDKIWARMNVVRMPIPGGFSLSYHYRGFHRGIEVKFKTSKFAPTFSGSLAVFDISLQPGSAWKGSLNAVPVLDGKRGRAFSIGALPPGEVILKAPDILQRPFDRGLQDLDDLTVEQGENRKFLAAGVPWFLTLFGRDSLLAGIMSSLSGTERLNGALASVSALQAGERDDWRDAEPGKLPHELRVGELTRTGALPFSPYYGGHDIPALFCIGLWNAWRWNGDRSFLREYLPTARKALEWCETLGDRDRDGFLEYGTRSSQGYFNQSWKDSGEAIVHEDGSLPRLPIATVELQGYFFAALNCMAELMGETGDSAEASRLRESAFGLRDRIEKTFWLEDLGFYAMGLDGQKRPIRSVSSNPAHLLWCGVPSAERALRIGSRLLQGDLFSGWGIRTLSLSHPSYNPLSYQLGSVWPHDTVLAAAGLQRYGIHHEAFRLSRALLEAASQFESERLPELFGGVARSEGLPIPYGRANIPQAWAAASPVLSAQLFLGLVPDAPNRRCFINPCLPDWLPDLDFRNIAIGGAKLRLTLSRRRGYTTVEECESTGGLEVISASVEAPLWGLPERPLKPLPKESESRGHPPFRAAP